MLDAACAIDVATLGITGSCAAGRAAFIFDVREENEWANRLDGAVHVPLGRVLDDPAAVLAGLEPTGLCIPFGRDARGRVIADTGVTAVSVDGGTRRGGRYRPRHATIPRTA